METNEEWNIEYKVGLNERGVFELVAMLELGIA